MGKGRRGGLAGMVMMTEITRVRNQRAGRRSKKEGLK